MKRWKLLYTKNGNASTFNEEFDSFGELVEFVSKHHYTDEANYFTNYWCELVKPKMGLFG